MKIPNGLIEKVPDLLEPRDYMNYVWLDTEKSILYAFHGTMMAVIPVELEEGDTNGPIQVEAVAQARKGGKYGRHLKAGEKIEYSNIVQERVKPEIDLPEGVSIYVDQSMAPPPENYFMVSVSVTQLVQLAKAICDDRKWMTVDLYIHPTEKQGYPIVVKAGDRSGGAGLLMPIYTVR